MINPSIRTLAWLSAVVLAGALWWALIPFAVLAALVGLTLVLDPIVDRTIVAAARRSQRRRRR